MKIKIEQIVKVENLHPSQLSQVSEAKYDSEVDHESLSKIEADGIARSNFGCTNLSTRAGVVLLESASSSNHVDGHRLSFQFADTRVGRAFSDKKVKTGVEC